MKHCIGILALVSSCLSAVVRYPYTEPIKDIAVVSSGALVQCQSAKISWDDDRIAKDVAWRFDVFGSVLWEDVNVDGNISVYESHVYFATPSRELDWVVDYPEGAIVTFQMNAWSTDPSSPTRNRVSGESKNLTVQSGLASDCIPASHYPLLLRYSEAQSAECGTSRISWVGGKGPYVVFIRPIYLDGVLDVFGPSYVVDTDDGGYLDWIVDYPVGTQLSIWISQAGDTSFYSHQVFTVRRPGTSTSCIPKSHIFGRRRWFQHPAAIAGFVVGGLLVLAGGVFGAWKGYQLWLSKRAGAITLE